MPVRQSSSGSQRGSALVYILIAIALLAALTISFMEPASQQTQSQNNFKMVSEFESQIDFIRTSLQECVILHPKGDSTIDNSSAGTPDDTVGSNTKYPIDPRSAHLDTPSTTADPLVRELRCPGNPGDDDDHQPVFGGNTGKFLPPPPAMFADWQWYNGVDGIFFWTYTLNTDAFIQTAMDKLNEKFGLCEADVIRSGSGSGTNMDLAGTVVCPQSATCFRMWLKTNRTAYVGDVLGVPSYQPPREISHYPDLTPDTPEEIGNCPI